jgi:hypothetical protein
MPTNAYLPRPLYQPDDQRQDRAILDLQNAPSCQVKLAANTTQLNSTSAALTFDTREFESHAYAIWNSTTALSAVRDGIYRVTANLRWSNPSAGAYAEAFFRHVRPSTSTTTDLVLENKTSPSVAYITLNLSTEYPMLKGDYFQIVAQVNHASGNSTFIGGAGGSRFTLTYVRPYVG